MAKLTVVDFTDEVIACLRKRSKAIKHSAGRLEWSRVKDQNGVESGTRRVDIDILFTGSKVSVRSIVWGDRWIWVDTRCLTKKGWAWEASVQGRFVGSNGAREFVQRIEETIAATWHEDKAPALIQRIWKKNVAQGPKRL